MNTDVADLIFDAALESLNPDREPKKRLDRAPPPPMQLPIFNPATLRYENPPRRLTPTPEPEFDKQ